MNSTPHPWEASCVPYHPHRRALRQGCKERELWKNFHKRLTKKKKLFSFITININTPAIHHQDLLLLLYYEYHHHQQQQQHRKETTDGSGTRPRGPCHCPVKARHLFCHLCTVRIKEIKIVTNDSYHPHMTFSACIRNLCMMTLTLFRQAKHVFHMRIHSSLNKQGQ